MNSHQRRVNMNRGHRLWPLGSPVLVSLKGIKAGTSHMQEAQSMVVNSEKKVLAGRVVGHYYHGYACAVEFLVPIDLDDANGERYAHRINFKRLKLVNKEDFPNNAFGRPRERELKPKIVGVE